MKVLITQTHCRFESAHDNLICGEAMKKSHLKWALQVQVLKMLLTASSFTDKLFFRENKITSNTFLCSWWTSCFECLVNFVAFLL